MSVKQGASTKVEQVDPLALEKEIVSSLKSAFPTALKVANVKRRRRVVVECTPEATLDVLKYSKNQLGFDHLNYITAVDWGKAFDVVYNFWSIQKKVELEVKTKLAHGEKDELVDFPTSTGVYQASDWFEREVYDLFGIRFVGHPDMRRILLREDWTSHPLRKIYDRRGNPIDPKLGQAPPQTWRIN
ncbi:MAG: NADH-quinone oxidoreductase subunit C, partial [Thermoprotei archaeon]